MPCLFVMKHINSQAFGVSGIPTRNELLKEMNFKPRLSLRDRRALIRNSGFTGVMVCRGPENLRHKDPVLVP